MSGNEQKFPYLAVFSDEIRHILRNFKRKNRALHSRLSKEIYKILNNPEIGKPLRYSLKSCRRIHVGSYVLVYEIMRESVFFLDFNHHDKIYKKWSDGFGLLGIIIVLAVIATLGTGGGLYYNEVRNQKSLVQIGLEKEKEAEVLKEKIENRAKEVTSEVDTSTWKTYRNEKYKFQLKYPNGWEVQEEYPEVNKKSEEAEIALSLKIISTDKIKNLTLFYLINENRFNSTLLNAKLARPNEVVDIDGYETVIEKDQMPYFLNAFVRIEKDGPDDGLEFMLNSFINPESPQEFSFLTGNDISLFSKILSTFKFIK